MYNKYLWFAIRINLLMIGLYLVAAILSLILIEPMITIFKSYTMLPYLVLFIPVFFTFFLIAPLYFAFKWLYKKEAKVKKMDLKTTIIWSVAIMLIIDFLLQYSAKGIVNPFEFLGFSIISIVLSSIVFYFAGRKYQPK
jgi:hypothetical protein